MWACLACRCLMLLSIVRRVQLFQYTHLQMKRTSLMQMQQMTPQTREKDQSNKRRSPANKKQAIKWVIQGVERCLAGQQLQVPPDNNSIRFRKNDERVYTYRRREDASLVDALYLLLNAKNQKETIQAGKRIEVLMRVGSEGQNFPVEITERVIKVTASTGLLKISVDLLMRMLSEDLFPSPVAYIAVMNALRKSGRVSQMEELLTKLASSCRRNNVHLKGESNLTKNEATGVDVVAFNSFIGALCDAAVKDAPYSSNLDVIDSGTEAFRNEFFSDANSTKSASSSEKFLYKAINLLKDDIARKKFELTENPDMYSYNTILAATAKCLRSSASPKFSENLLNACLRGMEKRGIQKDRFAYNALIEIAIQTERDSEVIRLIDEAIAYVDIDRYTINLALVPLLRAGRRHELMAMLRRFYKANAKNTKLIASAFEAFLNTLVQNSEVDFAREQLFDVFFLPRDEKRNSVWTKQLGSRWPDAQAVLNLDIQSIEPTTRHFNILLTGYSQLYRPVTTRSFRRRTAVSSSEYDGISEGDGSSLVAQNAYSLLDDMIRAGVPLDSYSVSSLMAFPTSSEEVSSLLNRIEPEMKTELSPAAYRSIISAFGRVSDPSSSFWVFFGDMPFVCDRRGMNIDTWNVLLGAIAEGSGNSTYLLDPLNSAAAQRSKNRETIASSLESSQMLLLVKNKTCADAAMCVLHAMRSSRSFAIGPLTFSAPRPNSQTYCQVATAQSALGTSSANSTMAIELFNSAKEDNAHEDGRFLNALLRCYADDIDGALKQWKAGLASAAVGVGIADDNYSSIKRSANLAAAYNGLMYVCGRAVRPGVALRLSFAMKKTGVEPNEISLNSYLSGKRVALNGMEFNKRFSFNSQVEELLAVECNKRQANGTKIRIILPS